MGIAFVYLFVKNAYFSSKNGSLSGPQAFSVSAPAVDFKSLSQEHKASKKLIIYLRLLLIAQALSPKQRKKETKSQTMTERERERE